MGSRRVGAQPPAFFRRRDMDPMELGDPWADRAVVQGAENVL
jgi:hypothetical protein